jgi:hypothetical protein
MPIGQLELKDAAKEAAGNWMDFNCFVWFREKEVRDPENWAIVYTHHRDSGLLDQSNSSVIRKAMLPFVESGDVVFENHSHWAVGHIDGFSIRVYRRGKITKAFRIYHELRQCIDDYPILDESDYSDREYEATVENIDLAAWSLKREFKLPRDWNYQVYDWLSQNKERELENTDDQGGWPSDESLAEAFQALKFEAATAGA